MEGTLRSELTLRYLRDQKRVEHHLNKQFREQNDVHFKCVFVQLVIMMGRYIGRGLCVRENRV